jgi:hypothetical protein
VAGAFRGYASHFVRGECWREARRLHNGGTFHARRNGLKPGAVESLWDRRTPDGDLIELPGRESEPVEVLIDRLDPPEPSWNVFSTDAEK